MSDWRIPLSDIDFGAEEENAILRVLNSRWLSMGPEVQTFEKEMSDLLEVKHAFAVSNGTAALHLAFLALGLGPGDEIIQPAINFVASANMTLAVGSTPVFADVCGVDEPTIDPADVERRITPRTRAIVVMHYGGYLCRMAEIRDICKRHGFFLIEDACHAIGARFADAQGRNPHGRMAGTLGDIAAFSFFSNKNLVTGEGGMIVTNREDLAETVGRLRSHGMTTLTWDRHKGHAGSYDVIAHGYNYRFDELRAGLGRCQLRKLKGNNERRRALVSAYRAKLDGLPEWVIPFGGYSGESACHLMVVVAPDEEVRLQTVKNLKKNKIQTSLHYPFLPHLSAFKKYSSAGLDRSISFAQRIITLPLFPTLTVEDVDEICACIKDGRR